MPALIFSQNCNCMVTELNDQSRVAATEESIGAGHLDFRVPFRRVKRVLTQPEN